LRGKIIFWSGSGPVATIAIAALLYFLQKHFRMNADSHFKQLSLLISKSDYDYVIESC
jgi:hypothetical protein